MKKITLFTFIVLISTFSYSQSFIELSGQTFPGVGYSSVDWGDYDNDGDLDILLSGREKTLEYITKIYTNAGNGSFTELSSLNIPGIYMGSTNWGDLDNDGDLDILITGNIDGNESLITKIFVNKGNEVFEENSSAVLQATNLSSSDLGDYDNDGDLDILLTGNIESSSFTKIYTNTGNFNFTELSIANIVDVFNGSATWGDYDNDGDLDILITGQSLSSSYVSRIYTNEGNGVFTSLSDLPFPTEGWSKSNWGDYDNDGDLDIIMIGYAPGTGRNTKIFTNNGDGNFTELTGSSFVAVSEGDVAWGDFDNNGYLDFIVAGSTGTSPPVAKIYKNNADNSFSELTDFTPPITKYGDIAWADFDNDNDLDFIITGQIDNNDNAITKLFVNQSSVANSKPNKIENLSYTVNGNDITFKWDKATDNNQNAGFNYNLYFSQSTDNQFICPPHAFTESSDKNGLRLISKIGNIQGIANEDGTISYTLSNVYDADKDYKWGVQAIDATLQGGEFSTQEILETPNIYSSKNIKIYPNPTSEKLYIQTEDNISSIKIFDIKGGIIKNYGKMQKKYIDVTNLSNGIYVIQIQTKQKLTTLKFHKM